MKDHRIGEMGAEVLFAGSAEGFVELDQSNICIPCTLAGRSAVDVIFTVDGKTANPINIPIK